MGQMTARDIPDIQYAALNRVAAADDRSAEAEVYYLIARRVDTQEGEGFGSKLVAKYSGVVDQNFEFKRDRTASEPVNFE